MVESALHNAIFRHGEIAMLAGEPCIGKTPDCPGVVLPRHQIGGSDILGLVLRAGGRSSLLALDPTHPFLCLGGRPRTDWFGCG